MQLPWLTIVGAIFVGGLAYFISEFANTIDQQLNACGTGIYVDRACQCVHPYTGTHCEITNCGYGELVDSVWDVDSITTPLGDIPSGCRCESQYWGFNCLNCTSNFMDGCTGACKSDYYGARCDTLCREGTEFNAEGVEHERSGGVYNYFAEGRGMCLRDGSVKCNKGTAGKDCSIDCKACVHGNCNKDTGECDCFAGFAGELCDAECPGRCSGNNGVCRFDGDFPFCECTIKFTGADCSLPCCARGNRTKLGVTNGDCAVNVGGCVCDPGWEGDECDCHPEKTCGGRGSCNADGTCTCDRDFAGRECEMCADDRIGPFCQYDKYSCPNNPGHGELVALNSHGDYGCKCNAGFTGSDCSVCTPSAYPKSGPEMCEYVVPASMCHNGVVRDDYAGSGVMCECTGHFSAASDCAGCKLHFYGAKCDVFCDSACPDSGGSCVHTPTPGCLCPKGMRSVDGTCQICGGDDGCLNGECYGGRCQCDAGWYGDNCQISAPQYKGKSCNGENGVAVVQKERKASCNTAADCTDVSNPNIANAQVALRAQKYRRTMFCYRTDVPASLSTVSGCCVDENADGKCDAVHLLKSEEECEKLLGETVEDICDERVLEGEVNVFEWCLAKELNCTKNGSCADPDFCADRCDANETSMQWRSRWEVDHTQSMETLMSAPWKFPIDFTNVFDDPYPFRSAYENASIPDVCAIGEQYDVCVEHLIPDDATVYNVNEKYVNGNFEPMPNYERCKLTKHVKETVDGNKTIIFPKMYVDRMEMVSDPETTIAYGRLGISDEAYYGEVNAEMDRVVLYGRGVVELIMYEYTDETCRAFLKKSAGDFVACQNVKIYELDYRWGKFCKWYASERGSAGGFDQRCYDQSRICGGCEDYQENCEGLPLGEFPMPAPCASGWDGFCDVYMDLEANVEGTCAFAECECTGYGIGGEACSLSCPVPQYTGSDKPCGEGEDPPWGICVKSNGAIAFGYEQGTCECFNGGNPSEGCALTCTEEQDCSADVDTPVTIEALECDFANIVSLEGSGWAMFNGTKRYFTEVNSYNGSLCGVEDEDAVGVCLEGPLCNSESIAYEESVDMCAESMHVHIYGDEPTASTPVSPSEHCETGIPKDLLPTQTNITSNKYCASQKKVRPYSGHTGVSGNPGTTYAEKLDACLKACTGDDKIVDVDSGYHDSDFWDYYNGSDVTHFLMSVWGRCYCYVDPIPDEDGRCPRHGGPASYDGNYKAFKVIPPDDSSCAAECVGNDFYSVGVNDTVPCICFNQTCTTVDGGLMYRYYNTPPNPGTDAQSRIDTCFEACRDKDSVGGTFTWQDDGVEISGFIVDETTGHCGCMASGATSEGCKNSDAVLKSYAMKAPKCKPRLPHLNLTETDMSDLEDLSTGQPARGDSKYMTETVPGKANDGDTDNAHPNQWHSKPHSNCANLIANAWWGVNLKVAAQHFSVTVHSRNCCNENGSEDFDVLVSNNFPNDGTGFSSFTGTTALCGNVVGMGNNAVVTIECHMDKPYKYVILRPKHCKDDEYINTNHYFHLPEVVVKSLAHAHPFFGQPLDPITCNLLLPDSMCNYWRGKCECAQPFTTMRRNNVPVYLNPTNSYRIALMQGYDIREYTPFMKYQAPLQPIMTLVGSDRFCGDEQNTIASYTCSECNGASFFKKNDDECVCSDHDGSCNVQSDGWDHYVTRDLSYSYVGRGICNVSLEMELLSTTLESRVADCATACELPQYDGFGITKDECFCTSLDCEDRVEADFETFRYTTRAEESVEDLVDVFDIGSPKLRCFKDVEHTQEVSCDWIRALKHFARGSSYRAGDCSVLVPGTKEDTQIPCSGHGFSSSGTCACDYAEGFDIRGSGVGLTFEAPNLRQTPFRGKSCSVMCPGYDMRNTESICSGHGLCTADGRCDCDQGFTGDTCSLACEVDQGPLTCSGHGTCDERVQFHRADIVTMLENMECTSEKLYLAPDRVVELGTVLYYMKKERGGLQTYIFDTVSLTHEKRDTIIDDYYIRGKAHRKPYGTDFVYSSDSDGDNLRVPYMPCEDKIRIVRERYFNNLFPQNKADVGIDCDLKYGDDVSGYTIFCGVCTCEENSRTGNWTGFDCRTPSLGFYGEDARRQCPGMTSDNVPCHGGGTCNWGSVDGEGDDIYGSAQCFCGDVTNTSSLSTAPRNLDNEILYHVSSYGVPLYVDSVASFALEHGILEVSEKKCWHPVEYSGATSNETCRDYCVENYPSSCIVMDGTTCYCCESECTVEYEPEYLRATSGKCPDLSTANTIVSYVQSGNDCQDAADQLGVGYQVLKETNANVFRGIAPCTAAVISETEFFRSNTYFHSQNHYALVFVECTPDNECLCVKEGVAATGITYHIGCEEGLRPPSETECASLGGTYGTNCVRDSTIICVPDKNPLINYNPRDCSCRYGWTGKRCDKERMMCLFSGEETFEGDKCICVTPDGTINSRTQDEGCCTLGTYFKQKQYSGFTPLQDFKIISDNVFYTEALLQVCKPAPTAVAFENDNKRILGIHNYVASTEEYVILNVTDCVNEYRKPLYYAEERYYSTSDTVATLFFKDSDVGDRVQACLHHCVNRVEQESDGNGIKGFTLTGFSSHTISQINDDKHCGTTDARRVRPFSGPTGSNRNPGVTSEQRVQFCNEACTGDSRLVDAEPRYHNQRFWDTYKPSQVTHFAVGVGPPDKPWTLGRCYCYVNTAPDDDGKCEDGSDAKTDDDYETYRIVRAQPQCACETEPAYFSAVNPSSDSKRFDIVHPYSDNGDCFIDSTGKVLRHQDQHRAVTFAKTTGIPRSVTSIQKRILSKTDQDGDFTHFQCYERCLQSNAYLHDDTTCDCVELEDGVDAVETTYSLASTEDPGIIKTLSNHYVITKNIGAGDETSEAMATEMCFDKCKRCPSFGVGNRTVPSGLEWDCYCLETDLRFFVIDTITVKHWAIGCAGVANDPDTQWKVFDRMTKANNVVYRLGREIESLTAQWEQLDREKKDMLYRCARTPTYDAAAVGEYGESDYHPNGWCVCECSNPGDPLNVTDTPVYSLECENCFADHGCTSGGRKFYDNLFRSEAVTSQWWYGRENEYLMWGNHRDPYSSFCDGKVWGDNIQLEWFTAQDTKMNSLLTMNASLVAELESARTTAAFEVSRYELFQSIIGDGYCVPDTNKHLGKTLAECKEMCEADANCNAFSYYDGSVDGNRACILASNGCDGTATVGTDDFPWVRYRSSASSRRLGPGNLEDLIGGYGGYGYGGGDPDPEPTCVRPDDTTGYIIYSQYSDYKISSFNVDVQCASNYIGIAQATVCSGDGEAFTVSGCISNAPLEKVSENYDGSVQEQWRPGKTYLTTPTVYEYTTDSFFDTLIRVVTGEEILDNPFVCNVESYLNYGDIPGETCRCPIWGYEKLYEEQDYVQFGQGFCLPDNVKQTGKTLQQCKDLCTADPECVAFSFYNNECILSSNGCDEDGEWNTNEYAWLRYQWASTEASKKRCCRTGEIVAYSVTFEDDRANLHSCLQECTREGKATARVSYSDTFDCNCGDKVYTEAECPVFESNCDDSQYSLRLEPVSSTEMCKCTGSYIMNGDVLSCPPGKFMPEDSACRSSCKTCPFGKFSEKGDVKCRECGAGKIRDSTAGCSSCDPGKYSVSGDKFCTQCVPGKFSLSGSGSCTLCPKGYSEPNSGSPSCDQCAIGWVASRGSTECTRCEPGTYSGGFGNDACKKCAPGKYGTAAQQPTEAACEDCAPGYASTKEGSMSCSPCTKGRYSNNVGRKCEECSPGYFQDEDMQTECTSCASGYYQHQSGQDWCKDCPKGYFSGSRGQSKCELCPPGQYADSVRNSACKTCGALYTDDDYPGVSSWVSQPEPRVSFETACDTIMTCFRGSGEYPGLDPCDRGDWFSASLPGFGDRVRKCCWVGYSSNCGFLALTQGDFAGLDAFRAASATSGWKICIPNDHGYVDSIL